MIGQSYLKRKHKIRFTKSEGMNHEGESTVFWPLFKRYGNAAVSYTHLDVYKRQHLMGLFDQDFLGIRHTRKMASLRYAEFSCVENGKICKSGMFVDLIGLMIQGRTVITTSRVRTLTTIFWPIRTRVPMRAV